MDLITRLNILPELPQIPLAKYGLATSADANKLYPVFPNFFEDPFDGFTRKVFPVGVPAGTLRVTGPFRVGTCTCPPSAASA